MDDKEFSRVLKEYNKKANRHIVEIEADMSYSNVLKVVKDSDTLRQAKNDLVAIMKKNYEQLYRTKRYRKLLNLYGNTQDKVKRKEYVKQLNEMQEQYNLTKDFCEKTMVTINKNYGIKAVIAQSSADDVWLGIEKILYSDGKKLHFSKYGELPCLRAKQIDRCIVLNIVNNNLQFAYNGIKFGLKIKDRFQAEELSSMLYYLAEPDKYDKLAVDTLIEEASCISTYRPCYAILVPKYIRGKYRVYLQIILVGKAKPKYNKDGTLRHKYGQGMIGVDVGTQTIAYTSSTEVGLKNLAERGNSISTNERKERLLYRKMDRSRRATNSQNYNEDGTIKKGKKKWKYSNNYIRLRNKHRDLCRKNAVNRKLAIQEDVNHLRELGDFIVTEPKNAKKLMKKAKETTKNSKGKFNKKKRFGKSIKNRCPGTFQSLIERKFKNTGGIYKEVPYNYRASQYDHTADDYIKKKLSDRLYRLKDGTKVQRDWYSSYLLYCYDYKTEDIDKGKVVTEFNRLYAKELEMIDWIKENKIKVLNSGIKVA